MEVRPNRAAGHFQPLGDLPRLAPQRLGQVERGGEGEIAELDPGRVLEGDALERDVEGAARCLADRSGKALLLIDDHALFRDSLKSLLESHDIEVVGEAGDGLAHPGFTT